MLQNLLHSINIYLKKNLFIKYFDNELKLLYINKEMFIIQLFNYVINTKQQ